METSNMNIWISGILPSPVELSFFCHWETVGVITGFVQMFYWINYVNSFIIYNYVRLNLYILFVFIRYTCNFKI